MKKQYILLLFFTLLIFVTSLYHRESRKSLLSGFPVFSNTDSIKKTELNIYLFFSMNNCSPCLNVIKILNNMMEKYRILGVVPEKELKYTREIRTNTSAMFEIVGNKKFLKYKFIYYPTLMGVANNGAVLFMIPGIPGEEDYIEMLIEGIVNRARSVLVSERY